MRPAARARGALPAPARRRRPPLDGPPHRDRAGRQPVAAAFHPARATAGRTPGPAARAAASGADARQESGVVHAGRRRGRRDGSLPPHAGRHRGIELGGGLGRRCGGGVERAVRHRPELAAPVPRRRRPRGDRRARGGLHPRRAGRGRGGRGRPRPRRRRRRHPRRGRRRGGGARGRRRDRRDRRRARGGRSRRRRGRRRGRGRRPVRRGRGRRASRRPRHAGRPPRPAPSRSGAFSPGRC